MNHGGSTGQAEATVGVFLQTITDVLNHSNPHLTLSASEGLEAKVVAFTPQLGECQSKIPDISRELPLGLPNSTDLRAEVRRIG